MAKKSEYPECEKMAKVSDKSQTIGEFLDWLRGEAGYIIAEYGADSDKDRDEGPFPIHKSIEQLLADYFEIDLNKVETEKRKMLDKIRRDANKPDTRQTF